MGSGFSEENAGRQLVGSCFEEEQGGAARCVCVRLRCVCVCAPALLLVACVACAVARWIRFGEEQGVGDACGMSSPASGGWTKVPT